MAGDKTLTPPRLLKKPLKSRKQSGWQWEKVGGRSKLQVPNPECCLRWTSTVHTPHKHMQTKPYQPLLLNPNLNPSPNSPHQLGSGVLVQAGRSLSSYLSSKDGWTRSRSLPGPSWSTPSSPKHRTIKPQTPHLPGLCLHPASSMTILKPKKGPLFSPLPLDSSHYPTSNIRTIISSIFISCNG